MTKIFWGDLHNHCAVSYGNGTAARTLANAKEHLDFCTITGHAFWPDMPMDLTRYSKGIGIHLGGFAKLQRYWPQLMEEMRAANQPGKFVTIPSYEWHSREYGDHNCYAPTFDLTLQDAPDLKALTRKIKRRQKEFMLLPHHCGYLRGHRGTNWAEFDDQRSPLVEIYSNHGSSEGEEAPYDYYHSAPAKERRHPTIIITVWGRGWENRWCARDCRRGIGLGLLRARTVMMDFPGTTAMAAWACGRTSWTSRRFGGR